ncbi:hypothetical protein [Teredinibacter haidensis]|uniref:hypothetical protein n=1 Tax=Teredinibacter haidensis TaxID=2731755 RepID=UPI000948E742
MAFLSANDLLAGGAQKYNITLPAALLPDTLSGSDAEVLMRPLTVNDVQRVGKAAKDEGLLTSVLMVQQALVEPAMSIEQVGKLPAGLTQFLLAEVNRISGLSLSEDELQQAVKAPLTKAVFVLAKEFGWTPSECSELTVGQVLLYLEMLSGEKTSDQESAA